MAFSTTPTVGTAPAPLTASAERLKMHQGGTLDRGLIGVVRRASGRPGRRAAAVAESAPPPAVIGGAAPAPRTMAEVLAARRRPPGRLQFVRPPEPDGPAAAAPVASPAPAEDVTESMEVDYSHVMRAPAAMPPARAAAPAAASVPRSRSGAGMLSGLFPKPR